MQQNDSVERWMRVEDTGGTDVEAEKTSDLEGVDECALVRIKPESDLVIASLREEVLRLYEYAGSIVVDSIDGMKRATEDLSLMANIKKALEGKRKEYLGPLQDHVKTVNDTFKTISEPLAMADGLLRSKILAWKKKQEELKRLAEEVEKAKQSTSPEIAKQAAALEVPEAQIVKRVHTGVGDSGTRKVKKFEVEDFAKVPDEYKVLDVAKVGKLVRAGLEVIPGIRIFEEDTVVVSAFDSE